MPGLLDFDSSDDRFTRLFMAALRRPPAEVAAISTLRSVSLAFGASETMVGLTRYLPGDDESGPSQSITFYSRLLDELSDQAATGVIAHELAHAWLNEHIIPEESKAREREADRVARGWGFGPELDALDQEAETVEG